jgi:hypothetical protein
VGVDERAYPLDAGSSVRFQPAFAAPPARHPVPSPLAVTDIDEFLADCGERWPDAAWRSGCA